MCAVDGENGLWLCQNHHKLFDTGIITIQNDGRITINNIVERENIEFIDSITTVSSLPEELLTKRFVSYLELRNAG